MSIPSPGSSSQPHSPYASSSCTPPPAYSPDDRQGNNLGDSMDTTIPSEVSAVPFQVS